MYCFVFDGISPLRAADPSIFTIGASEETKPNAAIPLKNGRT
jgi:hypothetical protein